MTLVGLLGEKVLPTVIASSSTHTQDATSQHPIAGARCAQNIPNTHPSYNAHLKATILPSHLRPSRPEQQAKSHHLGGDEDPLTLAAAADHIFSDQVEATKDQCQQK